MRIYQSPWLVYNRLFQYQQRFAAGEEATGMKPKERKNKKLEEK
jgi:hypothetical protein